MSQPAFIAFVTFAIAVVLTVAVAIVTFADEQRMRAVRFTMLSVVIGVAAVALQRAHLRINFTGSMPIEAIRCHLWLRAKRGAVFWLRLAHPPTPQGSAGSEAISPRGRVRTRPSSC